MNRTPRDWDDDTLARLLAGTRADAGAAPLARARARLAARADAPAWIAWLAHPVSIAVAAGLLVASAVAGGMLMRATPMRADSTTLTSALLGDDGAYGLPVVGASGGETADSGEVRL